MASLLICGMATICIAIFGSCSHTVEDTTVLNTESHLQKDVTHNFFDAYDRKTADDHNALEYWQSFDSLLAHIRITDYDTLGRPTRIVDANIQRGTTKSAMSNVIDNTTTDEHHTTADSTTTATRSDEKAEQRHEITRTIPWWQSTSFRIAAAALSAIIAVIIAFITRKRWVNRMLSWLLHKK